jgi:hypothetical protein
MPAPRGRRGPRAPKRGVPPPRRGRPHPFPTALPREALILEPAAPGAPPRARFHRHRRRRRRCQEALPQASGTAPRPASAACTACLFHTLPDSGQAPEIKKKRCPETTMRSPRPIRPARSRPRPRPSTKGNPARRVAPLCAPAAHTPKRCQPSQEATPPSYALGPRHCPSCQPAAAPQGPPAARCQLPRRSPCSTGQACLERRPRFGARASPRHRADPGALTPCRPARAPRPVDHPPPPCGGRGARRAHAFSFARTRPCPQTACVARCALTTVGAPGRACMERPPLHIPGACPQPNTLCPHARCTGVPPTLGGVRGARARGVAAPLRPAAPGARAGSGRAQDLNYRMGPSGAPLPPPPPKFCPNQSTGLRPPLPTALPRPKQRLKLSLPAPNQARALPARPSPRRRRRRRHAARRAAAPGPPPRVPPPWSPAAGHPGCTAAGFPVPAHTPSYFSRRRAALRRPRTHRHALPRRLAPQFRGSEPRVLSRPTQEQHLPDRPRARPAPLPRRALAPRRPARPQRAPRPPRACAAAARRATPARGAAAGRASMRARAHARCDPGSTCPPPPRSRRRGGLPPCPPRPAQAPGTKHQMLAPCRGHARPRALAGRNLCPTATPRPRPAAP